MEAIAVPLKDFVDRNSDQPGSKTCFKPKLTQSCECFEKSLLNDILSFRTIMHLGAHYAPEHIEVRLK